MYGETSCTGIAGISETKRKTYRTADVASANATNLEPILGGDGDHVVGVEEWTLRVEVWMAMKKKINDEGASSL